MRHRAQNKIRIYKSIEKSFAHSVFNCTISRNHVTINQCLYFAQYSCALARRHIVGWLTRKPSELFLEAVAQIELVY
jgi:hypothetical protein